jgi:hypothetical protein
MVREDGWRVFGKSSLCRAAASHCSDKPGRHLALYALGSVRELYHHRSIYIYTAPRDCMLQETPAKVIYPVSSSSQPLARLTRIKHVAVRSFDLPMQPQKRDASANTTAPPAAAAAAGAAAPSAGAHHCCKRWLVDTAAWQPSQEEIAWLAALLPQEDAAACMAYRLEEDRKRAVVSR